MAETNELLRADKANLTFAADKEGRIRITGSGGRFTDNAQMLLGGERLEVFWERGQVVFNKMPPQVAAPIADSDEIDPEVRAELVDMETLDNAGAPAAAPEPGTKTTTMPGNTFDAS